MIGHRLDISNGLCEVMLKTKDQKEIKLQIFTDMTKDQLWMRLVDKDGNLCENVFDRLRVFIDPSTPSEFPKARLMRSCPKGYSHSVRFCPIRSLINPQTIGGGMMKISSPPSGLLWFGT